MMDINIEKCRDSCCRMIMKQFLLLQLLLLLQICVTVTRNYTSSSFHFDQNYHGPDDFSIRVEISLDPAKCIERFALDPLIH